METRHLQSPVRLCILPLPDKMSGLTAWIMLTHRWDERQSTMLMFCDHPAVIRMLCFVSVIIIVKGILPKCVVKPFEDNANYYDNIVAILS